MSTLLIFVMMLLIVVKSIQSIRRSHGCNGTCEGCSACKKGVSLYERYHNQIE